MTQENIKIERGTFCKTDLGICMVIDCGQLFAVVAAIKDGNVYESRVKIQDLIPIKDIEVPKNIKEKYRNYETI